MTTKREASKLSLEELDFEIGKLGAEIQRLRKEQRPFLEARDALVQAGNEEARKGTSQNLG